MSVSSRVVFQRELRITPVWMWVLQRFSGLALGPLVALHIWAPGGQHPLINALLLALVLAHGFSGLRRLVNRTPRAAAIRAAAIAWCALVAALGLTVIMAMM